ncbi:MAG: flagellar hook-basal body complex protein FliE [Hyphomicrobiaceae bacterium]
MIDPITRIVSPGIAQVEGPARARGPAAPAEGGAVGAADFTSVLSNAIADVAKQLRQAEAVSMAGINGKASMQDVVEQVMAAEQKLQASIAVRDKIVAAYLEISRMAI